MISNLLSLRLPSDSSCYTVIRLVLVKEVVDVHDVGNAHVVHIGDDERVCRITMLLLHKRWILRKDTAYKHAIQHESVKMSAEKTITLCNASNAAVVSWLK